MCIHIQGAAYLVGSHPRRLDFNPKADHLESLTENQGPVYRHQVGHSLRQAVALHPTLLQRQYAFAAAVKVQ